MKPKHLIAATANVAIALGAGMASAQDMTIVSWGGAYSASQQNAYHDPY